jgi:hypothetical protein
MQSRNQETHSMSFRKLLLGAAIASTLGAAALPAQADVDISLNFGPPTVRYERVPAPRAGYVWAPGFWDYRGHNHVWVKGHWVRARPGFVYYAPEWRHDGSRWHLQREYWGPAERHVYRSGDRDRDGIPNRSDRDRDGDGVPNSRDSYPDNPRRN